MTEEDRMHALGALRRTPRKTATDPHRRPARGWIRWFWIAVAIVTVVALLGLAGLMLFALGMLASA